MLPHRVRDVLPKILQETKGEDAVGGDVPSKFGHNVLFVFADQQYEWNVSQWRALTPSDAMNKADGWNAKLMHVQGFADYLNPAIQYWAAKADLIVYQRNIISPASFDAMLYWQGMGKPVVVDLDDGYQFLPYSNPARKFWAETKYPTPDQDPEAGGALKMLEKGLRLADGLISPNQHLLADWSYVTANSYYLQNYAETKWWDNLPSREDAKANLNLGLEGKIVIGWGGSLSHYDSFWGSGIREAATYICQKYPDVIWMICGSDYRIYEQLPIPSSQKRHQPGVPPEKWPQVVRAMDIGVAPLFGPYDQRRSWIKGIEYLLAGVPWAGTHGETYRLLEGLGALGPETTDFWVSALSHIIDHIKELQDFQENERQSAMEAFSVDYRLDVFNRVFWQIRDDYNINRRQYRLPNVIQTRGYINEPTPA